MKHFKVYMNEHKLTRKSAWIKAARAVSTGKAKTALEHLILHVFGNEAEYQDRLIVDPDAEAWEGFWDKFERAIEWDCRR